MMNVSPDFSLPIRIIAPYFLIGTAFYILSLGYLWFLDPSVVAGDMRLIGWVHAYMIGFVMSVIVGAMGQLSVVVGEVHHRYPALFVWIAPLLAGGTAVLFIGFVAAPSLLVIGGGAIIAALGLFAFNLFVTLRRSRRRTAVTRSMQWSTFFLGIGLGFGLWMALGYAGVVAMDPSRWLPAHMMAVFGGYVMLNIMGVSTVLLPMFGACARPSDNDHAISFYAMITAVGMMIAAALIRIRWLELAALVAAAGSVLYYLLQVYRIFTSKKRRYSDVWERSVAVAFVALVASIGIGIYGYVMANEKSVLIAFWLLMGGFLGFLITAHLYKIVPFLVWFERFAPFIEERNVPTMQQLLPSRWADVQWGTALAGVVSVTLSIGFEDMVLWQAGAFLMSVSGGVLAAIVIRVLRVKL